MSIPKTAVGNWSKIKSCNDFSKKFSKYNLTF